MNIQELTFKVIEVARKTGMQISNQRRCFDIQKVEEKAEFDYVSHVDKESEKLLIRELSGILPCSGFITEEGLADYNNEEFYWIIDPLDGTSNFIHNYAPYCISIALGNNENIIVGVVYEICHDECFYAWKGGGAYLNGVKIEVSTSNDMKNAFVGLGLPYNHKNYQSVIRRSLSELYGATAGVRICGSAAANLCYVAAGRLDAWFEAFIKRWDYSAGALIVQEANGIISDFNGRQTLTHHVVACSNSGIHNKILSLTQNTL